MILHEVVHSRVRHQRVFVLKALAADLTGELLLAMVSLGMPLHIGRIHPHEVALVARDRLRRVGLLHVGVQHKLLWIRLAAGVTLEGSVNTMNDPQMCH